MRSGEEGNGQSQSRLVQATQSLCSMAQLATGEKKTPARKRLGRLRGGGLEVSSELTLTLTWTRAVMSVESLVEGAPVAPAAVVLAVPLEEQLTPAPGWVEAMMRC